MELGGQALLGFLEARDLLLERALAFLLGSLERSQLANRRAIRIALLHHLVELKPQTIDRLLGAGTLAAADQPADQSADSKGDDSYSNDGRIHDRDSPGTE